jgi:phytoene/squalene synthetase
MSAPHSNQIGSPISEEALAALAAEITLAGSRHTYYTIRGLVDRDLVRDAMCAYAYFRRLDDVIDDSRLPRHDRLALVTDQKSLMDRLYAGDHPLGLRPEEQMLAGLIAHERSEHGGLRSYLGNMMEVMAFDAGRRGRVITRGELSSYTETLATAVMDGLSYFIGNGYAYPRSPLRYLAVTGAHIGHMLRDAVEDARVGYYNIPREVLEAAHISPLDIDSPAYREWVAARVGLARRSFREGKRYILRLRQPRALLAGLAYCASFERVLGTIERDGYRLRSSYSHGRAQTARLMQRSSHSRSPMTDAGWRAAESRGIR